jgi:hypothetical protein
MRFIRGKVVGGAVIVEGAQLPEGADVTVEIDEHGGFDLDDASIDALTEADAACARGEGLTLDALMERLKRADAA